MFYGRKCNVLKRFVRIILTVAILVFVAYVIASISNMKNPDDDRTEQERIEWVQQRVNDQIQEFQQNRKK